MKISLCLAAVLLFSGCSSQQVYDSTQSLRVQDCGKLGAADRDTCLTGARASYAENMKRVQE